MSISIDKIDELISMMTLDEKVGQLNQHLYGWQCFCKNKDGDYELTQLFKDHVQKFGGVGAIYGILRADAWSGMNEVNGVKKEESLQVIEMIQNYYKNELGLDMTQKELLDEMIELYHCRIMLKSNILDELFKEELRNNLQLYMIENAKMLNHIIEIIKKEGKYKDDK